MGTYAYEGPEAPRRKPKPKARVKGGKTRVTKLRARQSGIHPVLLELASFAMVPTRRQTPRINDPDELEAMLTKDSGEVVGIFKKHRLAHDAKPPIATIPLVLLTQHLAQILWRVAKPPHVKDHAFVLATDDAETALRLWDETWAPRVPRKHRPAWFGNVSIATTWLENLRHVPQFTLALVRCCANDACTARFYLYRSGPLEPEFCSSACRRATASDE